MVRYVLSLLAVAVFATAPRVATASPIFIEHRAKNHLTISLKPLASTPAAQRFVVVTLPSPKANQQTLNFEVDGPDNTSFSMYSSMVTPKTLGNIKAKGGTLQPSLLYGVGGAGMKKVTLGPPKDSGDNSSGGNSSGYVCGCLRQTDIDSLLGSFRAVGFNYSVQEICDRFGRPIFEQCKAPLPDLDDISPIGGNTASLSAFVQRDACVAGGKQVGKAVLVFDLSKVSPTRLETGSLIVKPRFVGFDGAKQVKIKRAGASNGKFAGKSLLLASPPGGMSFTGTYGEVKVLKYARSKQSSSKSVKVADYVFYKNMILWRAPLGGVLSGGQGTIQMRSNERGYSICAKLVKQDQFFNGYPRNSGGEE